MKLVFALRPEAVLGKAATDALALGCAQAIDFSLPAIPAQPAAAADVAAWLDSTDCAFHVTYN